MKKLKREEGFTLAELLIVVAIIAVLVAVSIPIFTSKLEKSREATDIANMRAAKAAAVAAFLGDDTVDGVTFGSQQTAAAVAYYDADNGVLVSDKPSAGYGKGTTVDGGQKYTDYSATTAYTDKVIKVSVSQAGAVSMTWE